MSLASRKPVRIRQSGRTGTSWYQSLGLGVSGKSLRLLMHLHRMCVGLMRMSLFCLLFRMDPPQEAVDETTKRINPLDLSASSPS